IANNPFLEEDEGAPNEQEGADLDTVSATPDTVNTVETLPTSDLDTVAPASEGPEIDPSEAADYDMAMEVAGSYSGDYPTSRNNDQPETDIGQWARCETSLQDALRSDLC